MLVLLIYCVLYLLRYPMNIFHFFRFVFNLYLQEYRKSNNEKNIKTNKARSIKKMNNAESSHRKKDEANFQSKNEVRSEHEPEKENFNENIFDRLKEKHDIDSNNKQKPKMTKNNRRNSGKGKAKISQMFL